VIAAGKLEVKKLCLGGFKWEQRVGKQGGGVVKGAGNQGAFMTTRRTILLPRGEVSIKIRNDYRSNPTNQRALEELEGKRKGAVTKFEQV